MSEAEHQIELFRAIDLHLGQYPDLAYAFHPANGEYRHPRTAARLKAMGVRPGVPDVLLPVIRVQRRVSAAVMYYGLAIELKVKPNKPTTAQADWLFKLSREGWLMKLCYDWQEAWDLLVAYLEGKA